MIIDDVTIKTEELEKTIPEELGAKSPEDQELCVIPEENSEKEDCPGIPEERITVEKSTESSDAKSDPLERLYDQEKASHEYSEFCSLFPGVTLDSLPDTVCDDIRAGIPLSAAYALYERRRDRDAELAATVNGRNAAKSFKLTKSGSDDSYFSFDEVKQMSQHEVRTNYDKILLSMRHWK